MALIDYPIKKYLNMALRHGGEFAEFFYEQTRKTAIVVENNRLDKVLEGLDEGVGLRVIHDCKTAYAYTNDVSMKGIAELASTLPETIQGKMYTKDIALKKHYRTIALPIQRPPGDLPLAEKILLVKRANELARKYDPQIIQVSVRYSDLDRLIEIANSDGTLVHEPKTLVSMAVMVTAADECGMQTGYESVGGHVGMEILSEATVETLVQTACRRAVMSLKARKAPAGRMPVVLSSEAGGTMVHEAVGHGLEADLACQGLSVYGGRLGEIVASSLITVIDDPTLPSRRGSFVFDDEGTPSSRNVLIEKGVLKSYMFDRLMAMKQGTVSTGNGRRESYQFRPIVRMTNTCILPGTEDPHAIIRSTDKGLFVKKMGGGQVNTVNGDFVFEVTEAYLIDKGELGEPVRGATLTGNGPTVLKLIDRVGKDWGSSIGTCGKDGQGAPVSDSQPTLRIPELTVGGSVT